MKNSKIYRGIIRWYDLYQLWRNYSSTVKRIKKIPDPVRHFYFFPFYHTGGAEKIHADIVKAMHPIPQVVFFTSRSANTQNKDVFYKNAICFEIDTIIKNEKFRKKIYKAIIQIICTKDNNVIFSSNCMDYYNVIVPAVHAKAKCIDLIHALVHDGEPGAEYWSLPYVTLLHKRIVVCAAVKKSLTELYRRKSIDSQYDDKVEIIYNAIESGHEIQRTHSGSPILKILYVGRNSPEKRVELMLEIAQEMSDHENIEFMFVGPGMDDLKKECSSHRISFRGNCPCESIMKIYSLSDVLLLLSSREGLPIVLLEAMSYGVVPICTDVGGISEFVKPDTGFLISVQSPSAIKEHVVISIKKLINDKLMLERLSGNCINFIEEHSSYKSFKNTYTRLLNPQP